MAVITRSKSRMLSTAQVVEPQTSSKLSNTDKRPFKSTKSAAYQQPYEPKGAQFPAERTPEEPYPAQNSNGKELLQIINNTPQNFRSNNVTKAFWPCRQCSCNQGVFQNLIDSCVACGHQMDDHAPYGNYPWDPECDFLCEREELVTSVLQHARQYGVVVIRATPQVGKSALLKLLGHRIVNKELDLEPVYIIWENREKRKGLPYKQYLEREETYWREWNTKIRPHNPNAQTVYLIDEAQGSYEEEFLWSALKNHRNTRAQSLYVLVCVYGVVGISHIRDPNVESQALRMHSLQRIELRPSTLGSPCMLFRQEEVGLIVRKFATYFKLQLAPGVVEYLYHATHGHPGMVGLLLSHWNRFSESTGVRMPERLSPELLHKLIVQHEKSFVEWLSRWGRGVWSPWCESYVEGCLRAPQYCHLKLLDIKKALREVAMQPRGLTRLQKDFDAFAFCHKWGLLHTEQSTTRGAETTFTFASPLHRRVAYRRLFPGREPDAVLNDLSLQQICTNAIARISPSTLQNRRRSQSKEKWGIPEAAFQDELYCCLNLELHYLPILSEYAHTNDGRMDFYVSDKKWGIEVLQCGSNADIIQHISRFTAGGKYHIWDIMDDYIILNFCPRSALPKVKIEDEKIQSHLFHIVVEPDELTAEIYTHDRQLCKSWSLSEGRQRVDAEYSYNFDDLVPDTTSHCMLLHDETTHKERTTMGEMEVMRLRVEREKEEMRLQMEREKREIRLEMEREEYSEEDGEKLAQKQDKLVLRRSKKRKR